MSNVSKKQLNEAAVIVALELVNGIQYRIEDFDDKERAKNLADALTTILEEEWEAVLREKGSKWYIIKRRTSNGPRKTGSRLRT